MKLTCQEPVPNPHGEGSPWTCMRSTFHLITDGEEITYKCTRCGKIYTAREILNANKEK